MVVGYLLFKMVWDYFLVIGLYLIYFILGGFIIIFMLCFFVIKECMYIGEVIVVMLCGIIFGFYVVNVINFMKDWDSVDIIIIEFF